MAKFEVTNPEAIKLIADIKSGLFFAPYLAKLKQYRPYIFAICFLLLFIMFYSMGKLLYRGATQPVFLPPKLDSLSPSTTPVSKSEFESIRQEILNYSVDLPDPVIPPFDNNINLEVGEY